MNPKDTLKSLQRRRQRRIFSAKSVVLVGLLGTLQACGDGRPDFPPQSSHGRMGAPDGFKAQATPDQRWESVPLASDILSTTLNRYSEKSTSPALTEMVFSSSLGHLTENISFAAEELGLVGESSSPVLGNMFGQLAYGLGWTTVARPNSLALTGTDTTGGEMLHELQLSYENIPIHGARIKAIHDHSTNTTTYLTASVPQWLSQSSGASLRVGDFSLSVSDARNYAAQKLNFSVSRFHSPSRIFLSEHNQSLKPAYLMIISAEPSAGGRGPRIPLEVAISADTGDVLWQRPLAMHATSGEALLYVENKKASGGNLSTVSLPDLLGDGSSLSNPLFDVLNCHQRSRSEDTGNNAVCNLTHHAITQGNYKQIEHANEAYDELVSYAAVTKAMTWYRALDESSVRDTWDTTKWPGTRANFGLQPDASAGAELRLKIFVRTRTPVPSTNTCGDDSTPDNAQYYWSGNSGQGAPEILIGYGGYDKSRLSNCYKLFELGKDMDVIMHEFGHHVVFRGLSNAKPQSVSMHEGLADYFTYAISGNNFLAENSNQGIQFLRQGNISAGTTFKTLKPRSGGGYYSVMDLLSAPHVIGEFWSGILWEIRTKMGRDSSTGGFKFDKIVWDSIDLLRSDSGLYEGIVAFTESAKRYALRKNEDSVALQKIVQDAFVKYGFAVYTESGELAAVAELAGTGSSSAEEPVTKVKKTKRWGCGDVAIASTSSHPSAAVSTSSAALMLLLLASPLVIPLVAARRRQSRQKLAIRVQRNHSRN